MATQYSERMRTHRLFASARLRVFAVGDEPEAVTFAPYSDVAGSGLYREGFGERFFLEARKGAIHFVGRDNDWYQHEDMAPAIGAVRAWIGNRALTTYGSSMGGYAAFRFAKSLGASKAICLSPQYSIDPSIDWDRRWTLERSRLVVAEQQPPADLRTYILFDPEFDDDKRHAALIADATQSAVFAIPGAGHPVGIFLGRNGLLGPMVLDIIADRFDEARFRDSLALKLESPRQPRQQVHPAVARVATALGPLLGRRSKLQSLLRAMRP